jgi:small subunit ribosomal protein S16
MLAIRLTRTGRKGHAQYRMIVQEARLTPTSGRIVAPLGRYNPHTKETVIDKDKASFYLEHGAQPSDRVARLLKSEGVKLPKWVKLEENKVRGIRNPDKLRKNRPAEEKAPEPAAEVPSEEPASTEETATPEADEAAAEETTTPTEATPEVLAEEPEAKPDEKA